MFKILFKKYKSKTSPAGLENVINPEANSEKVEIRFPLSADVPDIELKKLGLTPIKEWKIYHVNSQPGLIIVKNPFTWSGQRYWIKKCLTEYTSSPNKSNLDALNLLMPGEDWWIVCQTDPLRKQILTKKMRWLTLGYHHNWDTKIYSEESKSDMPQELEQLCRICAKSIGFNVTAQAAIINFYPFGTTLSGHVDYSEPNDEAPIVSISFGGRAIFLIENKENEIENTNALLLESGDVIMMTGKSRRAMHAVPLIMEPLKPYPWNPSNDNIVSEWNSLFEQYVTSARININLRQVLRPGQSSLS